MKFVGPICASCHQVIELHYIFSCPNCQNTIHQTDHCRKIHQLSCQSIPMRRIIPGNDRQPDFDNIIR